MNERAVVPRCGGSGTALRVADHGPRQMHNRPQERRPGRGSRSLPASVALLAAACLLGCSVATTGTLQGVLVRGRLAQGPEIQEVRVVRSGSTRTTGLGMTVRGGDVVSTGPDARAVMDFDGEWEVILEPGSQARISSLWLDRGRAIVRKLVERARRVFKVENQHSAAGASGTIYVISVEENGAMQVSVLEGEVTVEPKNRVWDPGLYSGNTVRYGPLEQGLIPADGDPQRMAPMSREEAGAIRRTIEEVARAITIEIPDVRGRAEGEAREILAAAGLVVGRVDRRMSGQVPPGAVLSQSPEPGRSVRAGTPVSLVVEEASLEVPGLVGRPVDEAIEVLAGLDLRVDVVEQEERGRPPGTVIAQSPRAGSRMRPGTQVTLTVAQAPALCEVPRLLQATEEQARAILEERGLRAGQVGHMGFGDRVTAQEPRAGTRIECDQPVSFTIGTIGKDRG